MKRFVLLAGVLLLTVNAVFSQIEEDFANISGIHLLTSQCWQFSGVSLASSDSNNHYLSLTPLTVNGTADIRTPYIQLNTASAISFSYQLPEPLTNGASQTVSVSLVGLDGQTTLLKKWTLNSLTPTTKMSFRTVAPAAETKRLVIEVAVSGNQTTSLHIDDLKIDGNFNYNSPYACKDNGDGTTSIHYLKTFKGQLAASRVHLQWTVVENENNGHFEIEQSGDGRTFQPVATLKATSRVAVEEYSYEEPVTKNTYFRLKLVSKTGVRMYSAVLFFKTGAAAQGLSILENPVQQTLKIGFQAERKTVASLSLYNLAGTKIFHRQVEAQKGYNVVMLTLDGMIKPGMYLAEVQCDGVRQTGKMVKE